MLVYLFTVYLITFSFGIVVIYCILFCVAASFWTKTVLERYGKQFCLKLKLFFNIPLIIINKTRCGKFAQVSEHLTNGHCSTCTTSVKCCSQPLKRNCLIPWLYNYIIFFSPLISLVQNVQLSFFLNWIQMFQEIFLKRWTWTFIPYDGV